MLQQRLKLERLKYLAYRDSAPSHMRRKINLNQTPNNSNMMLATNPSEVGKFYEEMGLEDAETDSGETLTIPAEVEEATNLESTSVEDQTKTETSSEVADCEPHLVEDYPGDNQGFDINYFKNRYFSRLFEAQATELSLPIEYHKQSIVKSINSYKVVIIEGGTGCGKSTQVPYYILNDLISEQSRAANIYVTQPRRIAAKNIAKRICQEHEWELGSIVGYHIGLERVSSPDTMIFFCTSGVLLQKLINEKSLENFTHIIIDEVHERDIDTDLLLMIIKKLMTRVNSTFKLIIMSATMNMKKLIDYFTIRNPYGPGTSIVPIINKISPIASVKSYSLDIIYIDEIEKNCALDIPNFSYDVPDLNTKLLDVGVELILEVLPTLDLSLEHKSILVFLPGLSDIDGMHRKLADKSKALDIIPLHSCLSTDDQNKVFSIPTPGKTKVILATNIAESSITVRDVAFVIDYCLTKVLMKDEFTQFPSLKLKWSSKDQAIQRAGRTGRCCQGMVFRMVPEYLFNKFDEYTIPELTIAPLELSVLRVKQLDIDDAKRLLDSVLDPPKPEHVVSAILELTQIGALKCDPSLHNLLDGHITELGKVIGSLPIDVRLSKLIIMGQALDVISETITIAACLSTNKTIVRHIYGNDVETYTNKLNWAAGSNSDLFVCLAVVKQYKEFLAAGRSQGYIKDWCYNVNIDERKIYEVLLLEKEIEFRLRAHNITIIDIKSTSDDYLQTRNDCFDELMLKVAISAAFYPNYFVSKEFDADTVKRVLLMQDPLKTVVVNGFPSYQAILFYTQILSQLGTSEFEYIASHSKALIRFPGPEYDGSEMLPKETREHIKKALGLDGLVEGTGNGVYMDVYLTLKRTQSLRLFIRPYQDAAAVERLEYYHQQMRENVVSNRLPPATYMIVSNRLVDNSHLNNLFCEQQDIIKDYMELGLDKITSERDFEELCRIEDIENGRPDTWAKSSIFKPKHLRLRVESPLQLTFEAVLHKSREFKINIERSSVNSITLDADFAQNRQHILIASSVNRKDNNLTAYQTTLMPTIKGMLPLLCMLFAPRSKYRFDEDTGVILKANFGLGWLSDGQSAYRDTDIDIHYNVEFNQEDVDIIEECRSDINSIIAMMNIIDPGQPLREKQTSLRQKIMNLIKKRRASFTDTE